VRWPPLSKARSRLVAYPHIISPYCISVDGTPYHPSIAKCCYGDTQRAVRSLGGIFPSHQRDDMHCSGTSLDVHTLHRTLLISSAQRTVGTLHRLICNKSGCKILSRCIG
jgi:hypothetical protein